MQRVYEWHSALAKAALEAVGDFITSNKENFASVEEIAAWVQDLLAQGFPFRYAHVETDACNGKRVSDPFLPLRKHTDTHY